MIQKLLLVVLTIFSIHNLALAQDSTSVEPESEVSTLFGADISYGGFGSYMMELGFIDDQFSALNGGGGGVVLNRRFFIGGFGLGGANSIASTIEGYDLVRVGYGGLWLGYHFFPEKAVHFGIDTKMGWGEINYRQRGWLGPQVTDGVYVVNPSVNIGLNVTHWFNMNVGAGYRWVTGTAPGYLTSNKLSQPNVNLSFNFGWFN